MYAIVSLQGFQYRVSAGDRLRVPVLPGEAGAEIEVSQVYLIADDGQILVGNPTIADARVRAEVLGHGRGPKMVCGKYKRRKDYRRRWGHRTNYTELRIKDIVRPQV
ncbi:MAG: 50S ribosomal protein L21 [Candidatus Eisenbacteria bacterium]